VIGGVPEADGLSTRYGSLAGLRISGRMAQGIYELTEVHAVPVSRGRARTARPEDTETLLPWLRAFHEEAVPGPSWNEEEARRALSRRFADDTDPGLRVWVDGAPVSLAGYGGPTPNGVRIGPVFTPPEGRGRGYATSLVASLSAELLARGRRFCFLYTDLANETANAIYRRLGYRLVCESAEIDLAPVTPPAP
jgi:predicted GNAT family acetyltransferase